MCYTMMWYSTHIFHIGRSDVMAASWREVSAKGLQDSREHPDEHCELGKTLLWSGALFGRHREIIRHSSQLLMGEREEEGEERKEERRREEKRKKGTSG